MTDSGYLSTPSMESGPKRRFQDKALREALLSLPLGIYIGANRYDTDDTHKLHLWNDKGESFDIELLSLPSPAPEPPPRPNFIEWTRQALLDSGFTTPSLASETQREIEKLAERIETAVEQERAAQPAPDLGVEVLALALHEERSDRWGGCSGSPGEAYDDHMSFHRTRAERIAAEYTRLLHARSGRSQEEAIDAR